MFCDEQRTDRDLLLLRADKLSDDVRVETHRFELVAIARPLTESPPGTSTNGNFVASCMKSSALPRRLNPGGGLKVFTDVVRLAFDAFETFALSAVDAAADA